MEAFLDLDFFVGLFQVGGWFVLSLFTKGTALKNDDVPSYADLDAFKNLVVLCHLREVEELRTDFRLSNFGIGTTNSASFQQSLPDLLGL